MSNQLTAGNQQNLINMNSAMQDIQSMWGIPQSHLQSIQKHASITSTKHGMLSGVPILCKDNECPYLQTCAIPPTDRIVGSRCPQEIGALLARFEQLCNEFRITADDAVDLGQVKELVDLEIMMLRCDNKMAIDANFIERSVKDIAKNGRVLYEDKISQATQLKLMLIDKHSKILKDLNGTRSAKKESNANLDPSQQAAALIAKAKEIEKHMGSLQVQVIESDFVEVEEDDLPQDTAQEADQPEVVSAEE